jgi:hypothetical protein
MDDFQIFGKLIKGGTATTGNVMDIAKLMAQKIQAAGRNDSIQVGFIDGQPHANSQLSVADLAKVLHFGNATIPARPFLYDGILENKQAITDAIQNHYKKIWESTSEQALYSKMSATMKKIAIVAIGGIKSFVYSGKYKDTLPNSESTIQHKSKKNKRSDVPLIDTAQMINSLTYVINGEVKK